MKSTSKRYIIGAVVLAAFVLQSGCSKRVDGATKPAATTAALPASHASALGDLTAFRRIAADVAKRVDAGDLEAAKVRIKDLEVAWDEAEAGLKPRAAADWHVVDKAIDRALDAVRADPPDASACRQRLSELLKAFDSMK